MELHAQPSQLSADTALLLCARSQQPRRARPVLLHKTAGQRVKTGRIGRGAAGETSCNPGWNHLLCYSVPQRGAL